MRDLLTAQPWEAAADAVTASVKWYSNTKGVGFVTPKDGSPDALLHKSALFAAGVIKLNKGDTLSCEIGETPRGRQVVRVNSVRSEGPSTIEPSFRSINRPSPVKRTAPGRASLPSSTAPGPTLSGTVKFYDAWRGFGFVVPDHGEQDIYVTARTLEQTGLSALQQHQRVKVVTRTGPKGPIAVMVEAA